MNLLEIGFQKAHPFLLVLGLIASLGFFVAATRTNPRRHAAQPKPEPAALSVNADVEASRAKELALHHR